jgi:hypothetical protein
MFECSRRDTTIEQLRPAVFRVRCDSGPEIGFRPKRTRRRASGWVPRRLTVAGKFRAECLLGRALGE